MNLSILGLNNDCIILKNCVHTSHQIFEFSFNLFSQRTCVLKILYNNILDHRKGIFFYKFYDFLFSNFYLLFLEVSFSHQLEFLCVTILSSPLGNPISRSMKECFETCRPTKEFRGCEKESKTTLHYAHCPVFMPCIVTEGPIRGNEIFLGVSTSVQ